MSWEDDHKAEHGKLGTLIWLAGGIALFVFDSSGPGLFSWQAFVFLAVGMFASAIVVGGINYFIQRRIANFIVASMDEATDLNQVRRKTILVGYVLLSLNLTIAIVFLLWVYNSFFWI
ncbi:hypothetical protein [Pseudophaeobacter arcticus]|uniref:hypothetical protein n=1 Tax=Pseudophaeobacter arcticus TaxID=385492 RepID=UPI003A979B9F